MGSLWMEWSMDYWNAIAYELYFFAWNSQPEDNSIEFISKFEHQMGNHGIAWN